MSCVSPLRQLSVHLLHTSLSTPQLFESFQEGGLTRSASAPLSSVEVQSNANLPLPLEDYSWVTCVTDTYVEVQVKSVEDVNTFRHIKKRVSESLHLEWHLAVPPSRIKELREASLALLASSECPETVKLRNHKMNKAFSERVFTNLSSSRMVKHLYLDDTAFSESIKPLEKFLASGVLLTTLVLSGCSFPEGEVDKILPLLSCQRDLKVLFLAQLSFTDSQIQVLAEVLKGLPSLERLSLMGLKVSHAGVLTLKETTSRFQEIGKDFFIRSSNI